MSRPAIERLERSREQMRAALQDPGLPLETQVVKQLARRAQETLQPIVEPMARSHPWLLVIGAAALGALVVAAKPWRWSVVSVLHGLMPNIASTIIPGLVQQSLLDALQALLKPREEPPSGS